MGKRAQIMTGYESVKEALAEIKESLNGMPGAGYLIAGAAITAVVILSGFAVIFNLQH